MLEFGKCSYPKARKPHKCDLCGCDIAPGQTYKRYSGKYEGAMFDLKYCLPCSAIIDAYCNETQEREYDEDDINDWLQETECSWCACQKEELPFCDTCYDTCENIPVSCPYVREKYDGRGSPGIAGSCPRPKVEIQCSCCGQRDSVTTGPTGLDRCVEKGWNSFGSALYCPECSATWEERNGPNKSLCGPEHTKKLILKWR